MADLVGKNVGRYHLIEKFGEGGMATVYKAYDTRLDRHVAVKVIATAQQNSPDFLKRFEREAKALGKLSHPHIVNVHDYGEQDGAPYLVMEFLPGGTLKKQMGKPMSYQKASKIVASVARALEYAHQRSIIHRDVKPANILMTDSGMPMLTDFGIAKILEEEQTTALTGVGVGIGKPEYMSPEQGQGLPVDQRADIYALGVVFFELVTGRKPYQADTPMAIILKSMSEPLPRPQSFVPSLPDEVEKVIFKALAKKPQDRYQDMGAFADTLENLSQQSPSTQSTVVDTKSADDVATIAYPSTPSYDSMPAPVAPQPPSYPGIPHQQVPPTYQTMPPSVEKKKGRSWTMWAIIGGLVLVVLICGGVLLLGGGLVALGLEATSTPLVQFTPQPTIAPQATLPPAATLPRQQPAPQTPITFHPWMPRLRTFCALRDLMVASTTIWCSTIPGSPNPQHAISLLNSILTTQISVSKLISLMI